MRKFAVVVLAALLTTCWSGAFALESGAEKGLAKGLTGELAQNIVFSGLVEVEAFLGRADFDNRPDEDGSDLVLATVGFGIEAKITERINANIIFLYEEGENDDDVSVDEAFIGYKQDMWELTLGRIYLPFGDYSSHMISDPLTLELGETSDSAAMLGYDMEWLKIEGFLYNGSAQRGNPAVVDDTEESHLKDFGVAVTVVPVEGLRVGASLITDLADSNAELALNANGTNVYYHRVPAISSYVVFDIDRFQLLGEFVAALAEFDEKEGGTLSNSSPLAWNSEVAFAVSEQLEIAGAIGGSDEFPGAPELFVAFSAAWTPWDKVSLGAEVASRSYDDKYGEDLDSEDVFTAQLAVEF